MNAIKTFQLMDLCGVENFDVNGDEDSNVVNGITQKIPPRSTEEKAWDNLEMVAMDEKDDGEDEIGEVERDGS